MLTPLIFSYVFAYADHAILKRCLISINYCAYFHFSDVHFFLCSIISKARSAMEVLREVLDALNPRNPEVWSILLYDCVLSNVRVWLTFFSLQWSKWWRKCDHCFLACSRATIFRSLWWLDIVFTVYNFIFLCLLTW